MRIRSAPARRPAARHATCIALTGYGQVNDRMLSQAAGFDHHFVQPEALDVLARVLAAVPRQPDSTAS